LFPSQSPPPYSPLLFPAPFLQPLSHPPLQGSINAPSLFGNTTAGLGAQRGVNSPTSPTLLPKALHLEFMRKSFGNPVLPFSMREFLQPTIELYRNGSCRRWTSGSPQCNRQSLRNLPTSLVDLIDAPLSPLSLSYHPLSSFSLPPSNLAVAFTEVSDHVEKAISVGSHLSGAPRHSIRIDTGTRNVITPLKNCHRCSLSTYCLTQAGRRHHHPHPIVCPNVFGPPFGALPT
jgi:hypothetical protein